jgi:hypothetical protein
MVCNHRNSCGQAILGPVPCPEFAPKALFRFAKPLLFYIDSPIVAADEEAPPLTRWGEFTPSTVPGYTLLSLAAAADATLSNRQHLESPSR